jgi:hypothetical protein
LYNNVPQTCTYPQRHLNENNALRQAFTLRREWNMSYLTTLLVNKILVSGIDGRIVSWQTTWPSASCFSWYFSESYNSYLGGNQSVTSQFADENFIQILFTKPEEKTSFERKLDILQPKYFREQFLRGQQT